MLVYMDFFFISVHRNAYVFELLYLKFHNKYFCGFPHLEHRN